MRTQEEKREVQRRYNVKRAEDPVYKAECKARAHAYYLAHRAEHNASSREWIRNHRAKASGYTKKWKAEHPLEAEEQRRRNLAYQAKYRDRIRADRKATWASLSAEQKKKINGRLTASELRRKERIAGRPRPSLCEVCGRASNSQVVLHFDHDHTTGAFRGWLCNRRNSALGYCEDNPTILRALAEYLEGFAALRVVK